MTDPFLPSGDGATHVPHELRLQLIPTFIATLSELYEAEQENIAEGTMRKVPSLEELLSDIYLKNLHKDMFSKVWKWAGQYRQHDTNIGVSWLEIPVAVRELTADVTAWIEVDAFEPSELAIRFHHRLLLVHPFVNGNGRHGRFAAEYLVEALGERRFTWGIGLGVTGDQLRKEYQQALRRMDVDRDDFEELLSFARS